MSFRFCGWVLASCSVFLAASACTFASPSHVNVEPSDDTAAESDAGASAAAPKSAAASPTGGSCPVAKVDLSKLTACGNGKGHCYDKTLTPKPEGFNACPDASMVCIQDTILEAGGGKLKSCTSVAGPGGCMNFDLLAVPADQKSLLGILKQDSCDAGELCAPCVDPRDNSQTPVCQPIGVYDKPCTGGDAAPVAAAPTAGGSAAPAASGCCTTNGKSNGTCLAGAAIPASFKDQVTSDTCTDGNMCVPTAFLQGNPTSCAGPLGSHGVCMDKCFNGVLALTGPLLGNDGCGDSEVCIPCFLASTFAGGDGTPIPGCN